MKYVTSVGLGILIFFFLQGINVVSGVNEHVASSVDRFVYITDSRDSGKLQREVERLRMQANIREVLEVYYGVASIEEKKEVTRAIIDACELFDLRVELVLAVIKTESSFRSRAISHRGALGLMQLMPNTGIAMSKELDMYASGELSIFDMRTNIMLGCYYLKKMLDRYDNLEYALLAYNTGPTRLDMLLASEKDISGRYSTTVQKNMNALSETFFK